jgi:hypothetical protein
LIIEVDGVSNDRLEVGGTLGLASTSLTLLDLGGGFTESSYIIATYETRPAPFAQVSGLPDEYIIDYHFDDGSTSNNIALVKKSSLTAYEVWSIESVLAPEEALFEADPNEDGIANGMAFFLGAPNATISALSFLPEVTLEGTELVYRFDRADVADGVPFAVEYSSNLSFWEAAQDMVDGVSIEVDDNGSSDEFTVLLPMSLAQAAALFARLSVSE